MRDTAASMPTGPRLSRRPTVGRSMPTLRTIGALIMREMTTRFGRTPGGYLWALLQPLAMILLMALAFSLLQRTPALGTSFVLFKATGMLPYQLFRTPSRMVGGALSYSRALLAYPGVTWVDAVIARWTLNTLVMVIVTILILSGTVIYNDLSLILDWPMILSAIALAALLALGWGVFNIYMSERFDIYDHIWMIMTAPLMIASGVLFLYDDLPRFAQAILWYNPLVHIVGMMRAGFYSVYEPQYISVTLVLFYALIPLTLGLMLLRRHHRALMDR